AHIAHRKHEVSCDPAFYGQAPLLAGWCAQDWIDTPRAIESAGGRCRRPWGATSRRKRGVLLERNERESRARNLLARVKRWIGIGPVREIVLEIVVDSKAGPHRPGSRAGRIPRDAHARLQQQFRVILSEA